MVLKKWLTKMIPNGRSEKGAGQVVPFEAHGIAPEDLSLAAEKVVSRLQAEGFEAYVVGGAVRDLLLGLVPKDFDVATNARPEEIRRIFRRSRIIGRRFQIVHVMVGSEMIEVTTFRGGNRKARQNAQGRIMHDNTYGSMAEDAMRRDFTCNALYYNPKTREIHDFHHGLADIEALRLVMIGEPSARYVEDPVRLMRAARLAGKLGFQVASDTAWPIVAHLHLLKSEPLARMFDEVLKLVFSGAAIACLRTMQELGMGDAPIHPLLDAILVALPEEGEADNMVSLSLRNTDARIQAGQTVSGGFVLASVLWPMVGKTWLGYQEEGQKPAAALNSAIAEIRQMMEKGWGVPQRFSATMREIWLLQPQFAYRRGARPFRLLAQPRFRAAYDFLLLRAQLGEVSEEEAQWWRDFQAADESVRNMMVQMGGSVQGQDAPSKKRRRRKKKFSSAEASR